MTSEVAVMNRLAVALAADSAVSVSSGRRNKVFNTANKLFMLSAHHPVGIMVYSNGSLMGVPWEVLIKTFRQKLGSQEFDRLEEYAEAFLDYVEEQSSIFTVDIQRRYFLKMIESEFAELSREIQRTVQVEEADLADTDDWAVIKEGTVRRIIREAHAEWTAYEPYEAIAPGTGKRLRGECSGELAQLTLKYFRARGWHAANEETPLLNELAEFYVEKAYIAPSSFTGLVVAGFGRTEFHPVLKRLRLGNIYDGHLKRVEIPAVAIGEDCKVHVGIYADSGMADLFLNGISFPALEFVIEHAYKRAHELAIETLELSGVEVTDELWGKVEAARDTILHGLVDEIEGFRAVSSEFERALTHIPKDELASVAASLVNLNSFKKRMSMNVESVGGPVDVAVISKGDGFIWIDRKHYFDADKNPHFVRNHLRGVESTDKE